MKLAIRGATVIPMSPTLPQIMKNTAIVVEDDIITHIGSLDGIDLSDADEILDLTLKHHIIIPGLVNTHTHLAMTLFRGFADDLDLHTWLTEKIFPLEAQLTERDVYMGAKLGAVESALGGVTTVNSMYHFVEEEAHALCDVGIRGMIGSAIFGDGEDLSMIKHTKKIVNEWHNKNEGLIRVCPSPHSPYTVAPKLFYETRQLMDEMNDRHIDEKEWPPLILHTHIAETITEKKKITSFLKRSSAPEVQFFNDNPKAGIIEYLDYLDVLTPKNKSKSDILGAHLVHTTNKDRLIMQKKQVGVSHNPVSNLKLANGISPIHTYLDMKIPVGLGTDGSASNNSLSMFETMKMTALLQKATSGNPQLLPASEVFRLATIDGAKLLEWNGIGSLEVGNKADLAVLDFSKPHLTPVFNIISHLVYVARDQDVVHTMCNGKWIVRDGKPVTVDYETLREEFLATTQELIQR